MARERFAYQSTIPIECVAPTDVQNQIGLDNTTYGATCSFKVYDPAKDEVLSSAEASGQTILSVTSSGVFVVGDQVELTQDDGSLRVSTVSAIDAAAGTITIDDVTTDTSAAGNRVRVKLGATVTMTEFGTPKLEERNWGFRGFLASTHAGLEPDLDIDVEISFVGAGGNLDLLLVICATVVLVDSCGDC